MDIIRFNDIETVEHAIARNEPLIAVVSFDGKKAYVSHLDDGFEHHILPAKVDQSMNDADKYFRVAGLHKSSVSLRPKKRPPSTVGRKPLLFSVLSRLRSAPPPALLGTF